MVHIHELDFIFNKDYFYNRYIDENYDVLKIRKLFDNIVENIYLFDDLLIFFEDNFVYKLYLIFLCNHYNIIDKNAKILVYESTLAELDIVYLTKHSMIFHSLPNFKKWFYLLDKNAILEIKFK